MSCHESAHHQVTRFNESCHMCVFESGLCVCMFEHVCVYVVCVCVCMCVCVCACMHVHVHSMLCVRARARTCAWKCMRASADACESIDVERRRDTHKVIVGVFGICWLFFFLFLLFLFLYLHVHFFFNVCFQHACVWYAAFICVISLIHPHSHAAFTCATRRGVFIWSVHIYDAAHPCDAFVCVIWPRIHTTHSHAWHDLIRLTPAYVRHGLFVWRIHTCDMTHSCDASISLTWSAHRNIHTCDNDFFIRHIHTCDMAYSRDSFIRVIQLIHKCDTTSTFLNLGIRRRI